MKRKSLLAALFAFVFVVDRFSKLWAAEALPSQGNVLVIPGLLELIYSENRGMALGILSGNTAATLLMPIAALGLWFFMFRLYRHSWYIAIASALMLGGFAGNFVDRLLFGYVVDMVFFPFLPWFICNVADIAISISVGMIAASLLWRPQDWSKEHGNQNSNSPA